MGNQVEYGIRISVSGNKAAAEGIDEITQATTKSGEAAKRAGAATTAAQKDIAAASAQAVIGQRNVAEAMSKSGVVATQANLQIALAESKASASQAKLQNEQQRFIESLNRKAEAVGKTASQLALLRAQELGVADAAGPLIAKLAATEQGVKGVGMSAAATSAAMRNVPAQFTDIVVSLQAGQSPMTVMLQQGGQLKDMFGGVGNAAKALGTYVLGLVNPFTVGAAVVGVLTYAFYQGHQEMKEYEKAIILTGNQAGVTTSQLGDMAGSISDTVKSTKGAAAESLAAIVLTGNVASENLEKFAAVSVKMQKTIGQSVGDTAKDLSELSKSPLEASKKLSEQYHYLTKDTYDQIKALLEHGKTAEAAAKAQTAYIESFDKKSDQIRQNLGYIERSWMAVRDGAKGAWDAMLNIGREETKGDELKRLQMIIANKQSYQEQKNASGDTGSDIYKKLELELVALRDHEKLLKSNLSAEKDLAAAEGKTIQQREAAIKQSEKLDSYLNAGSRQTKAQALKEEAKKFDEATAGLAKTSEEYRQAEEANAKALKDINEKFKEKNVALNKQESAYASLILAMKEKLAVSQAELLQANNLTEGQKLRLKFDTDLREGKLSATAAQREYARSLASQIDMNNVLAESEKEQAERTKQFKTEFTAKLDASFKMIKATDDYIGALAISNEQAQLEITLLGKTETERKIAIEQFKVELALRKQIKEIENSKGFEADKTGQIQRATAAANERKQSIVVEVNTEDIQKARKELDAFLDPSKAQTFGEALAGALGNAGNAMQKLSANMQEYARTETELAKARANAEMGKASNPIKYAQDVAAINEKSARAQINNYANITGAAKGFFAEGTRGYKALEAAENAFRIVQLASDLAKGMSAAAVGIANQAQGDVYTALPRMAAMAAVMAGLGFATGFFGSSGGGGMSAEEVQKKQGTGSVFGDLTAKSESISKAIEDMAQTSDRLLPVNIGMLNALKNIESSMAGFTNLVVRDRGVIDGSNLGIKTGMLSGGDGITNLVASIGEKVFGSSILGTISRTISNLFSNTKQTIVDSGVSFGGKLTDLQAGRGFNQYASVDQTTSSWFGLSKSTTNSIQSQAVNAELSSQLGLIFTNMSTALQEANKALGGSSAEIEKTLADLTLASTQVSLKGLSGQALTEALNGVISKSLDEMAAAVFPQFDKFREVGEGYAQTVLRVANTFVTVNQSLESVGLKALGIGQAGVEAAVGLSKLLGGLENLQSATTFFAENFLTEAERMEPLIKGVGAAMTALGLENVKTLDDFKLAVIGGKDATGKLVKGLDLTTTAGQEMYAKLLAIAPQFKVVADYLASLDDTAKKAAEALKLETDIASQRKTLQDEYNRLTMSSTDLLKLQRDALFGANQGLFDSIQAIKAKQAAEAEAAEAAKAASAIAKQGRQLDIQIMEALGNAEGALAAQRQDTLDSIDPSLRSRQLALFAAQDAQGAIARAKEAAQATLAEQERAQQEADRLAEEAQRAQDQRVSDARSRLQDAVNAQVSVFEEAVDKFSAMAKASRAAMALMTNGDLSTMNVVQKYGVAKSDLPNIVASARLGNVEAVSQLQQFVELSKKSRATFDDYASDFAYVMSVLDDTASTAETQESIAKSQLDALRKQTDGLLNIDRSVLSVGDAIAQLQLAMAGGLSGIADAVTGQATAKAAAEAAKTTPNTASSKYGFAGGRTYGKDAVSSAYTAPTQGDAGTMYREFYADAVSWVKTIGDATGVGEVESFKSMAANAMMQAFDEGQSKEAAINTGKDFLRGKYSASYPDVATRIPGFASGGDFGGGIRMVGEIGPEIEVTGPSRIFNATDTANILRSANTPQTNLGGRQVEKELTDLRDVVEAMGFRELELLMSIEKLMRKNDQIGMPPVREVLPEPELVEE